MAHNSRYDMVVAIDFGTTLSGYAYSYAKGQIQTNNGWADVLGYQVGLTFQTYTSFRYNPYGIIDVYILWWTYDTFKAQKQFIHEKVVCK